MKYILIFYALWLDPDTYWDSIQVEPFFSQAECLAAARRLWEMVREDGAEGYHAICTLTDDMEA